MIFLLHLTKWNLHMNGVYFVNARIRGVRNYSITQHLKPQSHYSDNQSPTSDNHFFFGGCRRLSSIKDDKFPQPPKKKIGCQRSATGCRYSVTVALYIRFAYLINEGIQLSPIFFHISFGISISRVYCYQNLYHCSWLRSLLWNVLIYLFRIIFQQAKQVMLI